MLGTNAPAASLTQLAMLGTNAPAACQVRSLISLSAQAKAHSLDDQRRQSVAEALAVEELAVAQQAAQQGPFPPATLI